MGETSVAINPNSLFIFVKYLRFDLRPGLELDLGFEENGDLRFENWQNDLNRLFERFEI